MLQYSLFALFKSYAIQTEIKKKLLTNHSHFSLQVTSNSITKLMLNNFHPQDLARILQAIPTYTTSERISTSITLPTTFQQHIPIGIANIPSTKCE